MTGAHSPPHSLNGRTPSPPMGGSAASAQQLPPACGARQLSKLKRFLTTLQQFGSDISPEIGDRVRSLVLGLVVSRVDAQNVKLRGENPIRPVATEFGQLKLR